MKKMHYIGVIDCDASDAGAMGCGTPLPVALRRPSDCHGQTSTSAHGTRGRSFRRINLVVLFLAIAAATAIGSVASTRASTPGAEPPGRANLATDIDSHNDTARGHSPRREVRDNRLPPDIDSRDLVPVVAAARFETVDVYIDAGDTPLAAYQFTIHSATKSALLSGLEGGEHPAFAHPPYYDNAALIDEKVIVAAFSTAGVLPQGRTRVARLHVNVQDDKDAEYVATLQTAAGADGSVIPAKVSVVVTKR